MVTLTGAFKNTSQYKCQNKCQISNVFFCMHIAQPFFIELFITKYGSKFRYHFIFILDRLNSLCSLYKFKSLSAIWRVFRTTRNSIFAKRENEIFVKRLQSNTPDIWLKIGQSNFSFSFYCTYKCFIYSNEFR